MSDILSGHSFSFDSGVATHCGVNAALVYHHICFWIKQNSQREDCWHEGKAWMFQSQEQISEHFEFISKDQVKRSIAILIEKELLIKGNFSKSSWDKISWYSIPDEVFQKLVAIRQFRPIDGCTTARSNSAPAPDVYKEKNIKEEYEYKAAAGIQISNEKVASEPKARKAAAADQHPSSKKETITYLWTDRSLRSITRSDIHRAFIGKGISFAIIEDAIEKFSKRKNVTADPIKIIDFIISDFLYKKNSNEPTPEEIDIKKQKEESERIRLEEHKKQPRRAPIW